MNGDANWALNRAHFGAGRHSFVRALMAVLGVAIASLGAANVASAAERSAMVIDANSGAVLYATDADEPRYPASLTKMMTLYMAFDLIEKGRLSYTDKITISAQAAAQPPSKLELEPGETIAVRDAVRALVTKSANDIAVALAEHIAGSEPNFARLMTQKAREIGMSRTTFKNASGLPNDEQKTTARDMLTLALRLQDDFPSHYAVFSTKSFTYKGSSFRSHNTLLYHYQGTDGVKTGYTRASGFNLVSSVRRDGRHLVAAVFGGNTAGSRNAQMRAMLDRAFAKASTKRTRRKEPLLVANPAPAKRPQPAAWATTVADKASPAEKPAAKAQPRKASEPQVAQLPEKPAPAPASAPAEPQAASDLSSRIAVARVRPVMLDTIVEGGAETRTASQVNGAIVPHSPAAPPALRDTQPAPTETATSNTASNEVALGRAPSTLHEQLARILASNGHGGNGNGSAMAAAAAPTPQPPTYNLRGPVDSPAEGSSQAPAAASAGTMRLAATSPAARGSHGGFMVQVGAFNSAEEAARQLKSVRDQFSGLLAAAENVTEPVAKGDRQFYRARFAGFDQPRATEVCHELRRRSIDCLVARGQ
ncbi:MAG: D-alanyl-D-alanine carboxypeptidase [Hyphomicrobiaceae bacterium]|nr:D-alanyl-D-alanine carboxypeptidase [Hyphomicrobiaceae bacterium]